VPRGKPVARVTKTKTYSQNITMVLNPTSKDNLEYDHVPTSLIELATGTSL
jgi:hypothetical protein